MKKIIILISIIVLSLVAYLYFWIKKDINNPCGVGRDTVYQVGVKCRYAIFSGRNSNTNIYEWSLFDIESSPISINDDVLAYYDVNNHLYILTSNNYIKIDYINEKIYYYELDKMDSDDKKIFVELENKKVGHHKEKK